MLWQLLRGSGYGYGSIEDNPHQEAARAADNLPLDPIEVAGCADLKALKTKAIGCFFVEAALLLILCVSSFTGQMMQGVTRPERTYVNPRYDQHFKELERAGILKRCRADRLKFCSGYFAVPKKGRWARAIFNGKRLSERFKCPPPTNIPDICAVIRKIDQLNQETGNNGFSVVTGDFRHFFHQIKLSPEISKFFGLTLGNSKQRSRVFRPRSYEWTTLPMGWSYSPVIAQAIAWRTISHAEEGEEKHICIDGMSSSPMFVPVNSEGKTVGFAVVYYDNYLIVSTCPRIAEELNRRILRNAKLFKIAIKEHEYFSRKDLIQSWEAQRKMEQPSKSRTLIFLGVVMALAPKRTLQVEN